MSDIPQDVNDTPDTKNATFPDQKELEREISAYLSNKYGRRVRIVSTGQFPLTNEDDNEGVSLTTEEPAFHFDLPPEELINHLDQYVVGQDEAKAILATKICTHFNRISRSLARPGGKSGGRNVGRTKNNVLLIGPTGVGKTFLIKLIARYIGVPFVKGDATKFSETGYVGGDVEDLIRDLVRESDNNLQRAQFGIIYLDEIDKIASGGELQRGLDVSRSGVQRALLKPMEETEVEMRVPHDPVSMIEAMEHYRLTGKRRRQSINTRHILFIMSGVFDGLEKIVQRRLQQRSIGFESTVAAAMLNPGTFLAKVKAEDLVTYGFEGEFVGRLPVVAVLAGLSEDDLYAILSNPNSTVVIGKKQDFRAYGIDLRFTDEALRQIAALAALERTGARALVSVTERVLLHFERRLPSSDIHHLVVDAQLVADPTAVLTKLFKDVDYRRLHVEQCAKLAEVELQGMMDFICDKLGDYMDCHDVLLTPERLRMMALDVEGEDLEPREVCQRFVGLIGLINERAHKISVHCGLTLSFSEGAMDRILARHPRNKASVNQVCDQVLQTMEHGLRLLSQRSKTVELLISAAGIDAPDNFIDQAVSKAFKLD
ncbi:MAG: AAA family ATPase [Desulfobulbaceae bacterium]|nr:MAG: AAA family ATPase [Desulfobulbaceae bacterium]